MRIYIITSSSSTYIHTKLHVAVFYNIIFRHTLSQAILFFYIIHSYAHDIIIEKYKFKSSHNQYWIELYIIFYLTGTGHDLIFHNIHNRPFHKIHTHYYQQPPHIYFLATRQLKIVTRAQESERKRE